MSRALTVTPVVAPGARSIDTSPDVRSAVEAFRRTAVLPAGDGERFVGLGVMGMPFASGDVLALYHATVSSLGGPHTSVWHRSPAGEWRAYTNGDASLASSGYAAATPAQLVPTSIDVRWTAPDALRITVPAAALTWTLRLTESSLTPILADLRGPGPVPRRFSRGALRLLGWGARTFLGVGQVALAGRTPSGHDVAVHPQGLWLVDESSVTIAGRDPGPPRPLARQARLGGLRLPQRGLLVLAAATVRAP